MGLSFEDWRPFTSITLARASGRHSLATRVADILNDIEQFLGLNVSEGGRTRVERGDPTRDGDWTVGLLHCEERRPPRWASTPQLRDVSNKLVLICLRRRHVAIVITDISRTSEAAQHLATGELAWSICLKNTLAAASRPWFR